MTAFVVLYQIPGLALDLDSTMFSLNSGIVTIDDLSSASKKPLFMENLASTVLPLDTTEIAEFGTASAGLRTLVSKAQMVCNGLPCDDNPSRAQPWFCIDSIAATRSLERPPKLLEARCREDNLPNAQPQGK